MSAHCAPMRNEYAAIWGMGPGRIELSPRSAGIRTILGYLHRLFEENAGEAVQTRPGCTR